MASRSGITDPSVRPAKPLIEGHLIRCPNCLTLRNPDRDLKRLRRNEDYAMELTIVYQCRRDRGGCGHTFAPADMRIFLAYLNGDLVPKSRLDLALARISELEAEIEDLAHGDNSGDNMNSEHKVVSQ